MWPPQWAIVPTAALGPGLGPGLRGLGFPSACNHGAESQGLRGRERAGERVGSAIRAFVFVGWSGSGPGGPLCWGRTWALLGAGVPAMLCPVHPTTLTW